MTKKNIAKIICALAAATVVSLASCSSELTDLQNLKEKAKTVTLTFKADGGSWGGSTNDVTLTGKEGAELTAPATPAKAGYAFSAWNPAVPATFPSADTTYTATWAKEGDYTITYSNMDGAVNSASNPAGYNVETETITLAPATKTGYTFEGWYSDSGLTAAVTQIAKGSTGAVTLYAKWTANTYTVTFNANTGSGTMTGEAFTYDTEKVLTICGFEKTGYSFAGWNTEADGSGTSYAESESVKNLSAVAGGTVTLYAKWAAGTDTAYKVEHYQQNTADDNYTLAAGDTQNLTGTTGAPLAYGDSSAANTYAGFTYSAALTSINGTVSTTGALAADGSTVVKLYYSRNIITLTFDLAGGTTSTTFTATTPSGGTLSGKYGAAVSIADPTKTDYTFAGWSSTVQTTFSADATYTASWKTKNTMTLSFISGDVSLSVSGSTYTATPPDTGTYTYKWYFT